MTRVRKQQERRELTAASDTSVGTGSAAVTCPSLNHCSQPETQSPAPMTAGRLKCRWRSGSSPAPVENTEDVIVQGDVTE